MEAPAHRTNKQQVSQKRGAAGCCARLAQHNGRKVGRHDAHLSVVSRAQAPRGAPGNGRRHVPNRRVGTTQARWLGGAPGTSTDAAAHLVGA